MNKQQEQSERRVVCPRCWWTVQAHAESQTYVMHGKLRQEGQEPAWCSMSNQPVRPLFPLGQVVATPGALAALARATLSPEQLGATLLERHQYGDWGEIPDEDAQENIRSVQQGFRLLSAYTLSTGVKLWLITEADRSATTFLLPSEY